jgi:hypothetical protein
LITRIIFGDEYRSLSSSLCSLAVDLTRCYYKHNTMRDFFISKTSQAGSGVTQPPVLFRRISGRSVNWTLSSI